MGSMTRPASDSLTDILARLDDRVRRVDEERWLSSRYAKVSQRDALIVLYAFYYELARVRGAVSDPMLGQIRFQWWRDALEELQRGEVRQHDVVIALSDQIAAGALAWQPLRDLIEPFEGAFVASDRALEPEATLAVIERTGNRRKTDHQSPGERLRMVGHRKCGQHPAPGPVPQDARSIAPR